MKKKQIAINLLSIKDNETCQQFFKRIKRLDNKIAKIHAIKISDDDKAKLIKFATNNSQKT